MLFRSMKLLNEFRNWHDKNYPQHRQFTEDDMILDGEFCAPVVQNRYVAFLAGAEAAEQILDELNERLGYAQKDRPAAE